MSTVLNWGRGGLPMESHWEETRTSPVPNASIPPKCVVPLQSFPGHEIQWTLGPGDRVDEGTVIASGAHGRLHSPIPGVIENILRTVLPDGLETSAAHIRLEGSFYRSADPVRKPGDWSALTSEDLKGLLRDAGVLFASSPLGAPGPVREERAKVVVINALQAESYLTLPGHLLALYLPELKVGIQVIQKIYGPQTTLLALHTDAASRFDGDQELPFGLAVSEYRYPAAHEKLLLQALRRQNRKLFADIQDKDVLMITPQVLFWVYEAVVLGRPVLENFVAYGGGGFHHGGIIKARIGTPAANLILDVGGLKDTPEVILYGGPHLGSPLSGLWNPVVKGAQGILACSPPEVNSAPQLPCLRCGACAQYCPVGLEPLELELSLKKEDFRRAEQEGISRCIQCGICSSVCPSRIPLMEGFQTYLAKKVENHG